MLGTYSPGDMENYLRGTNTDSIHERLDNLRRLPLDMHGMDVTEECALIQRGSVLINEFGEDEGKEYVLDRPHLRGLNQITDINRYMLDDRGTPDSFNIMRVSSKGILGEETRRVIKSLLRIHKFSPVLSERLHFPNRIALHQHRIEDAVNGKTYNFYLPSKSEVRKLEHWALVQA